MEMILNCTLLGNEMIISDSFIVNLNKSNNIGDSEVLFSSLRIENLKHIIYDEVRGGDVKEVKINCKKVTLWKVEVDVTFEDFTEELIKNKGQELIYQPSFEIFKNQDEANKSLIIVELPTIEVSQCFASRTRNLQ
ncbi:hypothetical protein C1646_676181 [Rhizophagus diaphanus]|nr:hypothetical protein C1646_676181 [Rhizophagus diaphanus] [Rhizophagus sp. MUCL 43196]